MDPESVSFQPRDDFWRMQGEMLRVQQSQAELADRVARLERKNEEDSRLKNVWGSSSPFPSVLGGTPQQVPLQQPTAEHFSSFDDQSSNLIGNLQLDADDEPRRIGTTSRANSVRFDETANHGHWAHASRSSLDLIPRTGSGLGGHSMSERSYSHKSDGRQSSAGHSVHSVTSGRANSLTSYGLTTPIEPPGLAPGLFILGSVPAIIRCWLSTNFKHDTLLYAAVCTGSYTSYLDIRLIESLGYQEQITQTEEGVPTIKLSVYLPEAVPLSSSSRSDSPAPQLPSLSVDFTVVDRGAVAAEDKAIQIFLGSDLLRAHNADILFSTNQLTLYDEDRTKLQVPLVRPEDDRTFKYIFSGSGSPNLHRPLTTADDFSSQAAASAAAEQGSIADMSHQEQASELPKANGYSVANGSDDGSSTGRRSLEQRSFPTNALHRMDTKESASAPNAASAAPRTGTAPGTGSGTGTSPAIWSSWRRDTEKASSLDWASVGKNPPSTTTQKKDTGIKVLRPSRSGTRTMSTGASQATTPSIAAGQSRFFDDGKRREGAEAPWSQSQAQTQTQTNRSVSGEQAKVAAAPADAAPKTRTTNPVGGASAFAWLNNGRQK